jgi:hypothetical protein
MILLASLAGVAYGLAYSYGGAAGLDARLFWLNLFQFLLFTYPLLATRFLCLLRVRGDRMIISVRRQAGQRREMVWRPHLVDRRV